MTGARLLLSPLCKELSIVFGSELISEQPKLHEQTKKIWVFVLLGVKVWPVWLATVLSERFSSPVLYSSPGALVYSRKWVGGHTWSWRCSAKTQTLLCSENSNARKCLWAHVLRVQPLLIEMNFTVARIQKISFGDPSNAEMTLLKLANAKESETNRGRGMRFTHR